MTTETPKTASDATMELPIVDFSPFVNEPMVVGGRPTPAQQRVADAIDQACRVHGFVCLRNTGIPRDMVEEAFGASQSLFRKSDAEKALLKSLDPTTNTGYNGFQSEALNPRRKADLKEVFNIRNPSSSHHHGRDDDGDDTTLRQTTPQFVGTSPAFQQTTLAFWDHVMQLSHRFSQCCALALGLDLDYFTKTMVHKDLCTLRLLHYPPLPLESSKLSSQDDGATTPEAAIRVGEHTDFGAYTFLFVRNWHDESSHGLQVKSIEGGDLASGSLVERDDDDTVFTTGWRDVILDPAVLRDMADNDTSAPLLVNTGALMARWTNDVWRATAHRVVVKPEARDSHRYSMAVFLDPDKTTICEVDPKFVPEGATAKYPPISSLDYLLMKLREVQDVK